MATGTEVVTAGWWPTTVAFLRDSYIEIRTKTTWPDVPQVRQASIAIIIFVLAIGMLISILDVLLNLVLVTFIPSLFT
jgi:preprotein translocase SecE subunit